MPIPEPNDQPAKPGKIRDPDLIAEARKGWLYPIIGVVISFAGLWLWNNSPALPVLVVAAIAFGPVILVLIGLVCSINAWRDFKSSTGIVPHAIAGNLVSALALVILIWLLLNLRFVEG